MRTLSQNNRSGFTLLELISVVAVMAILYSIALPSYQAYMLRVHRTEALVALVGVASCQEKIFALTGRYDTTQCIPDGLKHYSIRINPPQVTDSLLFTAWAEPQGPQIEDSCGQLGLDQAGRRRTMSEQTDISKCWNGR